MDLYGENILDHYKNPHSKGKIETPSTAYTDSNPLCGDKITIELNISDGKISDAVFNGKGCAISQAATDMLLEEVLSKKISDIESMKNEDVYNMLGVPLSTSRVKCALLGLVVLKQAITKYKSKN